MWASRLILRSYGMNAAAIDYIWKTIQESERSDELQFMADEVLITTAATRGVQPRPDQSSVVGRDPITEIAINPKLAAGDSLQTAKVPPLPQP
jgi:hypothetical protein